jgi:hypothetical protein
VTGPKSTKRTVPHKADGATLCRESVADRNGDCRLANAPRAHDGHKTLTRKLCCDHFNHRITSHHASEPRRHGRDPAWRTGQRRRGFAAWHSRRGPDETITTPRDVDHIACTILTIAEGFAQRHDLGPQVAVIHPNVRPDAVNQIALTDHIASALHQGDQNVHGPAAEFQRLSGSFEQPFGHRQPEWAERDYAARGSTGSAGHLWLSVCTRDQRFSANDPIRCCEIHSGRLGGN